MLTNGTGLSHTASLACVVLAGLGLTWCREGRPVAGAILAANAVGFCFTVRPQVALPVGGVLSAVLLWNLCRAKRWPAVVAFALSATVWVAAVGWYDAELTGSPLRLPWTLYPTQEAFGFSAGYTVWDACLHLLVSIVRMNGWWLGLPLGLGVLAVWSALGRPAAGMRLWAACGLALVVLNFCYFSPGVSETGPVYYYELLLPGSLLAAHTAIGALRRWPRLATSLLLVHLVFGTGSFVVEQGLRLARLRQAIHGRVDAVLAELEQPALLIHESHYDEKVTAGWVFSFPVRFRGARDPIVTFPRHGPEQVRALRAMYADRHCYYYRNEPLHHQSEVYRCEQAEELLARPEDPDSEGPGRMPAPTAGRLGYFPLLEGLHFP